MGSSRWVLVISSFVVALIAEPRHDAPRDTHVREKP